MGNVHQVGIQQSDETWLYPNIIFEVKFKTAMQVFEIFQAMGKLESARGKGPPPLTKVTPLLPLLSTRCERYRWLMDSTIGWALQRALV